MAIAQSSSSLSDTGWGEVTDDQLVMGNPPPCTSGRGHSADEIEDKD